MSNLPAAVLPAVPLAIPGVDLEHEWRTPMTVIQSAAEVLRAHDDLTVEERYLFLDALIEETARLRACLETVLTGGLGHAAGR
ncbi:MAG TPA: histidine kinase dimerization/phospho-acceptor domain-containing protein [Rhodospirillales bacterium]|nr:histidine kinase dimerization/phospho-acceptor domain-containing protein [Rhodospirillales bacterium]